MCKPPQNLVLAAIASLLFLPIPQPSPPATLELETLFTTLTFGFREVWRQPRLRALLLVSTLFWFFHDQGGATYDLLGSSEMVSAVAALIAGPLAEHILEPAMIPTAYLADILGGVAGTGPGAGMALLFVVCALAMVGEGLGGYWIPALKRIEAK